MSRHKVGQLDYTSVMRLVHRSAIRRVAIFLAAMELLTALATSSVSYAAFSSPAAAQAGTLTTATMPAPSSVSAQGTCTYGTWGGPGKQCSGSQEISYYCPSGTTLSGSECVSPAGVEYVCSYGSYNGSECVGSAEVSYYCPSGTTLSGTECTSPPTFIGYDCTEAGYFGGTTTGDCYFGPVSSASVCSSPWTYTGGVGGDCEAPASEVAPAIYTCSYGSLSGFECIGPEETSYYCPSGTTLSGTECVSPAGVAYVCSYGSYNGSECVGSAEVSYYCPSGTTLSGTECVSNPTSYILSWAAPSGTDALGKPLVASQQIISMPYNGSTCTTPWTPINSVGASATSATVSSPSSSECYSVQAVRDNWTSTVPSGVEG